jgi:hypothetical protein
MTKRIICTRSNAAPASCCCFAFPLFFSWLFKCLSKCRASADSFYLFFWAGGLSAARKANGRDGHGLRVVARPPP